MEKQFFFSLTDLGYLIRSVWVPDGPKGMWFNRGSPKRYQTDLVSSTRVTDSPDYSQIRFKRIPPGSDPSQSGFIWISLETVFRLMEIGPRQSEINLALSR